MASHDRRRGEGMRCSRCDKNEAESVDQDICSGCKEDLERDALTDMVGGADAEALYWADQMDIGNK